MTERLLTRDAFREGVFARDGHRCVLCGRPAVDAHHIVERRLWTAPEELGGYFMGNGASVCEEHHIAAERSFYPPQHLWQVLGVADPPRPKSFARGVDYNKWGVAFRMPNRVRIKYPSTPYLPFSPGWRQPYGEKDDEAYMDDVSGFLGAPLVITVKMDGSNVQMTRDHLAARNGTDARHGSFDYLKALHAQRYAQAIPEGVEVFGEWLYAKHSIRYEGATALAGYLQVFGVYHMDTRMWGSWEEVEATAAALGVPTVPVVKRATYAKDWEFTADVLREARRAIEAGHEGVVVRIAYPFHYGQFEDHIAKYVREGHVQTDEHWSQQATVRNALK